MWMSPSLFGAGCWVAGTFHYPNARFYSAHIDSPAAILRAPKSVRILSNLPTLLEGYIV